MGCECEHNCHFEGNFEGEFQDHKYGQAFTNELFEVVTIYGTFKACEYCKDSCLSGFVKYPIPKWDF